MTFWLIIAVVLVAGGVGGAVNALMSDNGFVLPKSVDTNDGRIVRPGFLGNILIGGIAAASQAAGGAADSEKAAKILTVSPALALSLTAQR